MKPVFVLAILASFAGNSAGQPLTISTIAGGGALPVPALSASIGRPAGVATDASGNFYFLAQAALFKVDSNGALTRIAGGNASGSSGDNGPAVNAQLDGPTALAADRSGNLYIAEGGGHIRKITADRKITTIAGNGICHGGCFADGSGDGGPATSANMGAAWGLAFDSAGTLYISDDIPGDDFSPDAVRVRKVTPDGIITTVAGTGAPGLSPDSGDGGPATGAQFA
jgi:hypothetical protein